MTIAPTRDCQDHERWRLVALERNGRELHVGLDRGGRTETLRLELEDRTVCALWDVVPDGRETAPSGLVDRHVRLLVRSLELVDASAVGLLIRLPPRAGFWLQLATTQGRHWLDLDVVDAVCLLRSGRLPVHLVNPLSDGRAVDPNLPIPPRSGDLS